MKHLMITVLTLCCFCGIIHAQNIEVKGTVTGSADAESLIGVNVSIKGEPIGTITDFDGNYSLSIPSDATLVYSYIGYDTQEIAVKGRTIINVSLKESSLLLEEVVAVGYRTERKADLTGAVSVVKIDDMMSVSENNPIKALQGRVPGLTVSADGNPSGSATMQIRGISSLRGNDQPLYIIDGVASTGGMHELNSNDIESIQVLRDASAASIYGSRAANGVIVITTKQGKKGTVKVNFDAYVTATSYHNRIDVLSSKEYAQVLWKAFVNSGKDPNSNGLGIRYEDTYNTTGNRELTNVYFPEYLDSDHTMKPANTDWFDQVTRTGMAQSYNLSVSNGTENGNFFFSLGYYDNEGLVKDTDFSRISARMNSSYKIWGDIVTIGENFSLNRTSEVQQPYQIVEAALIAVPFIPVHTEQGGWGGPIQGLPDRQNPARLVDDNKDNRYNYWRLFGNAFINLQPIKKLNIRSSFGVDYGNFFKRDLLYSYKNGFVESNRTKSTLDQRHWMKWTWSNTATFDFEIDKNRFETLLGMEMFRQQDIEFTASREDFVLENPDYMWPDQGTGTSNGTGWSGTYSLMSFFGKISYAYDDRYLASVTLRRDGSSRFGKNNRWGFFPAFNLGWKLNQEVFMENTQDWLSDFKVRFGWGQTGNQEIENLAIYRYYVTDYGKGDPTWNSVWGTAYDIDGTGTGQLPSGFKRVQLDNDDLKWETTTQTNIGIDFGFLNQRIYGSLEFYLKKTTDMLFKPGYVAVIGEGGDKWYNGASMENKGVEFSLGYRGTTSFGFGYDITGNISTNKNEMTYLPQSVKNTYGGNGKWDNILGRPLNSFYGYVADGIFKSQDDVDNHATQDGKDIGRIRYRDLNGDGIVNDDDRTWIGDPYPDFSYGLNVNLNYRDFDLIMYFQGVQGVDVDNTLKRVTDFWSVSDTYSNKGGRLMNAFDPVTNPGSDIPSIISEDSNNEARFSTYFIENGSYLKMRNLQVGYNFPKKILEKIRFEKLRVYASAQNLFTIKGKNYTGADPENPAWGYPIPLTFTFGVNVSF